MGCHSCPLRTCDGRSLQSLGTMNWTRRPRPRSNNRNSITIVRCKSSSNLLLEVDAPKSVAEILSLVAVCVLAALVELIQRGTAFCNLLTGEPCLCRADVSPVRGVKSHCRSFQSRLCENLKRTPRHHPLFTLYHNNPSTLSNFFLFFFHFRTTSLTSKLFF